MTHDDSRSSRSPGDASTEIERERTRGMDRRSLMKLGGLGGAGAAIAGALGSPSAALALGSPSDVDSTAAPITVTTGIEEKTISELAALMDHGQLSALELVNLYTQRIEQVDRRGPKVNSVVEINPDARRIARNLDHERRSGHVRGPLHGIPVLLKENIDTGDKQQTTAGSLALLGTPAPHDATVAARLRAAGAVILGKTNLSEWANFRGFSSSSGWSGRGGQTNNPYFIDRNPCGSSSGTGAAVSASFAAAGLGTETDGSIVCPASLCGVVGIKPTVGLTSRAGVIPIAHSQDTVGPHGRTVADAAAILGALVGVDPRDPATAGSAGKFHTDYTQFLDPDGLSGRRIGVARGGGFTGYNRETDAIFEVALEAMADAGAVLVDPAEIPSIDTLNADQAEIIVLIYEFKRDLNAYLATRTGLAVDTLADVIAFNSAHAEQELKWFGQEFLELAEQEIFSEQEYLDALARGHSLAREQGIDAVLADQHLDALVAPTGSPAWPTDLINGDHFTGASSGACAVAGYPIINVPMGNAFGLPVGISFMGTAYSEPTLIRLASGFEHVAGARLVPQYRRSVHQGLVGRVAPAAGRAALDRRLASLLETGDSLRRRLHSL